MQRRKFIQTTALGIGFAYLSASKLFGVVTGEKYPELKKHKIAKAELVAFDFHWPRPVGKNSRKGVHGQFHKNEVLKLTTDQGAVGWGLSSIKIKGQVKQLQGKFVSQLVSPENGLLRGLSNYMDFALHDLMGVILHKPVYELLGAKGTKKTPVYSGMIYFDELEPEGNPSGMSKIIENCQWDIDYGYRQLKVKIGRSGKWYPHDEGLKKDIEVVRLIHQTFPDITILVDANDQYTLSDTMEFLKGIGDIPLLWIEEPFRENYDNGKKLRQWMDANGFEKTLYADGEANPDHALCLKMGKEGIMNAYLPDIRSYGLTRWRHIMPQLKKQKMWASPHAWGSMLKTHYIAHLSAACGNVVTIEGVTCLSDDIDFGDYKIANGKMQVSDKPGFGMKLLK